MNYLTFSFRVSLSIMCFLFCSIQINAQWSPATLNDDTYRYGNTGIGAVIPMARLHLHKGKSETLLRLQKTNFLLQEDFNWDVDITKKGNFFIGYTQNPAGSASTRLVIETGGNVGIGTAFPDQKLTIFDTDEPVMRFERGGSNWDYEIYATSGGQLRFRGGTNGTGDQLDDHMVMNGQGKLMIGTESAPSTLGALNIDQFHLFVAGGILTEEVIVRTGWADYVFADDYNLQSLKEVEQHIAQKGYLHNTPSADKIAEEGLNVGAITVNQQEKIEELFLHLITMEKRVEQLEKENQLLKMQQAK